MGEGCGERKVEPGQTPTSDILKRAVHGLPVDLGLVRSSRPICMRPGVSPGSSLR